MWIQWHAVCHPGEVLITGRVLAVQEQRFRLLTEGGQVYLLTLAHNAPLEPVDLCDLQDRKVEVTVDFEGEPNLKGCVARNVLGSR
jgi:hypothetical protein